MTAGSHAILLLVLLCCCGSWIFVSARVPQQEVEALEKIVKKLGATSWKFNADTCQVEDIGLPGNVVPPSDQARNITCGDCQNNTCHITIIGLKRLSLPGILPPELVQLPNLKEIDLAYNFLQGPIPVEWASTKLEIISLMANRLSGEIPGELGNLTSLTYLNLEGNELNGTIPPELRKLVNLKTLFLSSNQLTGSLPSELSELTNLTDFRINDNNFNSTIPDFIQNWKKLRRLEMLGSGLEGPIPSSISGLNSLIQLKISDIKGRAQAFPDLSNMTGITRIVLRNCNISGEIPPYVWNLGALRILDLSFNKLIGKLPDRISSENWQFIFLTGNFLSGNVPESILRAGTNVDLSYNNFSWQGPDQPACRQNIDLNLNLFRSSSLTGNGSNDLRGLIPCKQDLKCPRLSHSFYVNCGGEREKMNDKVYETDKLGGGAAEFHMSDDNWGFSSSGDFMDDNNFQNKDYTAYSPNATGVYATARVSPSYLTYFHHCLRNGNYTVSLHFAEIQFTSDQTFRSLGRRIFDIYIQDKLVEKDFNIINEVREAFRPLVKPYNASVTNNILEIRFYWAGKGTTRIPARSVYGPLISAISVDPNYDPPSEGAGKKIAGIVGGVLGSCLILLALGIILRRRQLKLKRGMDQDIKQLYPQMGSFTLKQIKSATNNFDMANKIGEGGFGPVHKGQLPDGTVIAVKQLSSKSKQGNREFLNEIAMISCLQHPNLVRLYGCCIEGDQLLLVYEYLENNSLARAMHGQNSTIKLDWPTRHKICLGVARGLAFLHEESRLKIVHRDIKSTNILLDGNLNPKISDFGLAKLDEEEKTHISTRVAGTIGYMAPEYALWGYLTHKADVYSFGIVALEIVSGKHHANYGPGNAFACLLDWACNVQQNGKLTELVDEKLGTDYNKVEAERMIKVALLCTNASSSLRPTMSEVVTMLEGKTKIPEIVPDAKTYSEVLRFKAVRDFQQGMKSSKGNDKHHSTTSVSWQGSTSTSAQDLYDVREESYLRSKMMEDQYELTESWTSNSRAGLLPSSSPTKSPSPKKSTSPTKSSPSPERDLYSISK